METCTVETGLPKEKPCGHTAGRLLREQNTNGVRACFCRDMQYLSGVTDTQVKWTLENRSDNPGVRDGDMFLANDPWIGAAVELRPS